MTNKQELIFSLEDLDLVAKTTHTLLGRYKILTYTGSMGSGKTTLIQALLRYEGITDIAQSPTFHYMSTYVNPSGLTLYHFDLYRLRSCREFVDAGLHEYLYEPMSYALIEWPEIILSLLTKDTCHISIDYINESTRSMRYFCP